ncbi:unnamed protein product [Amaranthus hypochondriacus]
MEEMMGYDKRAQLIKELLEGEEIAKELRNHILREDNQDLCNSLLEKMLSTFDKTITMAKLLSIQENEDHPSIIHPNNSIPLDYPLSKLSPNSENSHPNFPPSKRRRSMETKWTKIVKISTNGSLEGVHNDGFSWRKYGQKDILGAKFPRGYYRCTYRHSKGCAATKQVQQSNEDQSIYQIMYKGEHTCSQGVQIKKDQNSPIQGQLKFKSELQSQSPPQLQPQPQQRLQNSQQDIYVGIGAEGDIKVESEDELIDRAKIFRSFSFTQAHLQPDSIEDNNLLSFCPSFVSPATSYNCIPVSPFHSIRTHEGLSVQTQEVDFHEAISGMGTLINTPIMDVSDDFQFTLDDLLDFCDNSSFDQI